MTGRLAKLTVAAALALPCPASVLTLTATDAATYSPQGPLTPAIPADDAHSCLSPEYCWDTTLGTWVAVEGARKFDVLERFILDSDSIGNIRVGADDFANVWLQFTSGGTRTYLGYTSFRSPLLSLNLGVLKAGSYQLQIAQSNTTYPVALNNFYGVGYKVLLQDAPVSSPVPEPATEWSFAAGLGLLGIGMWRVNKKKVGK